jgi:hypothetical protein
MDLEEGNELQIIKALRFGREAQLVCSKAGHT